jgi:3',5'-cyclic AMP phosphodiesterase CpdA
MRLAQITDAHITAAGTLWKGAVDTAARLRDAVAALNRISPDLVVLTGDLVETGDAAEYANAAAILADLAAPLMLLPGNHDDRAAMRASFPAQGWQGPFLQTARDAAGLRVLALDTVEPQRTAGSYCDERLAWLDAALAAEQPTLVFLHHPPCPMGLPFMDQWPFAGGDALAARLSGRRDILRLACGHVHAAVERHWAGTLVSAAPALSVQISPVQAVGAPLALSHAPGAIRLHDWVDGSLTVSTLPLG